MFYPDLEQVKSFAADYNIIPVAMEAYADMDTPISIFKRVENDRHCFLLESVEGGEKWARYSFIGRNPFLVVKGSGNSTEVCYRDGRLSTVNGNPVAVLKDMMKDFKGAPVPDMPRFNGGAVGFFSYDTARYFENLPDIPEDDIDLPEMHFMFADELIAFDHFKQKMHLIVNIHVNGDIETSYNSAVERLKEIHGEILASRWKLAGDTAYAAAEAGYGVKFCDTAKEGGRSGAENGRAYA